MGPDRDADLGARNHSLIAEVFSTPDCLFGKELAGPLCREPSRRAGRQISRFRGVILQENRRTWRVAPRTWPFLPSGAIDRPIARDLKSHHHHTGSPCHDDRTPSFASRRPALRSIAVPFTPGSPARALSVDGYRRARKTVRSRPALELMEERTMLSTVSIPTFQTVSVSNGTSPTVALAPMQNTVATGVFQSPSYQGSVEVNLQAGELFTASADVSDSTYLAINGIITPPLRPFTFTNQVSALSVTGPSGQPIASESTLPTKFAQPAIDPVTGQSTNDTSVSFYAPSPGTYTISVRTFGNDQVIPSLPSPFSYVPVGVDYTLHLRPIEQYTQTLDPDGSRRRRAGLVHRRRRVRVAQRRQERADFQRPDWHRLPVGRPLDRIDHRQHLLVADHLYGHQQRLAENVRRCSEP